MLLQTYNVGHVKKKASIFHLNQIHDALQLPHNTTYWILRKAAIAISFCGGLRCCELRSLTLGDVQVDQEAVWIEFNQGKQRGEAKRNGFSVPFNHSEPQICMASRVVNYRNRLLKCLPDLKPEAAFWRMVLKDGYSATKVMDDKVQDIMKNLLGGS